MSVRKMNKQAGFSLIELMIVVAIIGILATVAAPNFKRFMAKSKQGEAKQNLAAYYMAQRAFLDQWAIFPGEFSAAGFRPSGTLSYRITALDNTAAVMGSLIDYSGPNIDACVSTAIAPTTCFPLDASVTATSWQEQASVIAPTAAGCTPAIASTVAGTDTFVACASANLGANRPDQWQINQEKRVWQLAAGDGLP